MRYANKQSFPGLTRHNFAWFFYLVLILAAQYGGRPQGAAPAGLAFADTPLPCPECPVEDSMVFETYYPSPYGLYEELRGDKIIVGDTDGVRIQGEATLPPSGTITFNPVSYVSVTAGTNLYEGTMYYDKDDHKFRYYDNTGSDSTKYWKDLGGGGGDYWKSSTANANDIYYTQSGNVGIGTANPQYKFTVEGAIGSTEGTIIYNCSGTLSLNYSSSCTIVGRLMNTQALMGSAHTPKQCTDIGGTVTTAGGQQVCKFGLSSCPGGWTQYSNWSTTQAVDSLICGGRPSCVCGCPATSCITGQHTTFSDAPPETCSYYDHTTAGLGWCAGCAYYTASAKVTSVGCY